MTASTAGVWYPATVLILGSVHTHTHQPATSLRSVVRCCRPPPSSTPSNSRVLLRKGQSLLVRSPIKPWKNHLRGPTLNTRGESNYGCGQCETARMAGPRIVLGSDRSASRRMQAKQSIWNPYSRLGLAGTDTRQTSGVLPRNQRVVLTHLPFKAMPPKSRIQHYRYLQVALQSTWNTCFFSPKHGIHQQFCCT